MKDLAQDVAQIVAEDMPKDVPQDVPKDVVQDLTFGGPGGARPSRHRSWRYAEMGAQLGSLVAFGSCSGSGEAPPGVPRKAQLCQFGIVLCDCRGFL